MQQFENGQRVSWKKIEKNTHYEHEEEFTEAFVLQINNYLPSITRPTFNVVF